MKNYSIIDKCPITGQENPITYFNLGSIPLVNNLCNTREESIDAERYPLDINYYTSSSLSALSCAVDGELLFEHYLFKTDVNKPYIQHCKNMLETIQHYVSINNGTSFADIGGNDGTLLHTFKSELNYNISVINIDPSINLTEISKQRGIDVLVEFFSLDVAKKLNTKLDVITSTNVFQHLKDINSFANGIEYLLNDDGIWLLEFPYWIHDTETNQFDQIYHEHMYYHSITPLNALMQKCGLKIINIAKQNIHGGTLRLIISKVNSKHIADSTIEIYLQSEKKYNIDYYINWGKLVQTHISNSKLYIDRLKQSGSVIFGFGAAAKGCIYMHAMNIDYNQIDYVIDDTDIKQGKFIPGTGIEIVSRDILKKKQPDYILILAHNFADHIIESLKHEYQGKFITLIPNIKEI